MSNHTPEGCRPCHDGSGRAGARQRRFRPKFGEQRLHLNPVIAKLAEGRTVYGLQAGIEMSIGSARAAARRRLTTSTSTWSTTRSICQRVLHSISRWPIGQWS